MYIKERVVAVEYCGTLQMWVLSVHFLSNVWCLKASYNSQSPIFKKLVFVKHVYIWNKGIIILIHRMEDKEGMGWSLF